MKPPFITNSLFTKEEIKPKKKGRKEKESQYYRLKPPPKAMIQSSHDHNAKQT
jgi:hypothetical protein